MARSTAYAALVLLAMTSGALAAGITCTGTIFVKSGYSGNSYNVTLTPQGDSDKAYVWDLKDVPSGVANKPTWDDLANSVKLSCTCLDGAPAATCAADFGKTILRVWAEPGSRGHGGGESLNVTCTPAADGTSCAGALSSMPTGWGSRLSAVAILYNNNDFTLPKSRPKTPTTPAGAPKPSPSPETEKSPAPKPAPSPETEKSPAPKPSPATGKSPKPAPSPKHTPGTKGKSPKPSPAKSPKPSPAGSGRRLLAKADGPAASPDMKEKGAKGPKPSTPETPAPSPEKSGKGGKPVTKPTHKPTKKPTKKPSTQPTPGPAGAGPVSSPAKHHGRSLLGKKKHAPAAGPTPAGTPQKHTGGKKGGNKGGKGKHSPAPAPKPSPKA